MLGVIAAAHQRIWQRVFFVANDAYGNLGASQDLGLLLHRLEQFRAHLGEGGNGLEFGFENVFVGDDTSERFFSVLIVLLFWFVFAVFFLFAFFNILLLLSRSGDSREESSWVLCFEEREEFRSELFLTLWSFAHLIFNSDFDFLKKNKPKEVLKENAC